MPRFMVLIKSLDDSNRLRTSNRISEISLTYKIDERLTTCSQNCDVYTNIIDNRIYLGAIIMQ